MEMSIVVDDGDARRRRRRCHRGDSTCVIKAFKRGHKGDIMCVTNVNCTAVVVRYDF